MKKKSIRKELICTICGSVVGVLGGAWVATITMTGEASASTITTHKAAIHHTVAAPETMVIASVSHSDQINSVSEKLHISHFNN